MHTLDVFLQPTITQSTLFIVSTEQSTQQALLYTGLQRGTFKCPSATPARHGLQQCTMHEVPSRLGQAAPSGLQSQGQLSCKLD